jgi:hypothetical protein
MIKEIKHPFYQSFSWWVIILFILYLLKIIKFSIFPIVSGTIIGCFIFLIIKYFMNKYYNFKLSLFIFLIHLIPLLFINYDTSLKDILYNFIIFIIYIISLELQNTNIVDIYNKLLKIDNKDITIYSYYKDAGLLP